MCGGGGVGGAVGGGGGGGYRILPSYGHDRAGNKVSACKFSLFY